MSKSISPKPRRVSFEHGQLHATAGVLQEISAVEVTKSLTRHFQGDWGELETEDREANERALVSGGRLFSSYSTRKVKFYIITEADRSMTTVLLPSEY